MCTPVILSTYLWRSFVLQKSLTGRRLNLQVQRDVHKFLKVFPLEGTILTELGFREMHIELKIGAKRGSRLIPG